MRILLSLSALLLAVYARSENAPAGSKAQALKRNAVVCIFADPRAGNVDKEVKRMVDAAAKCDVNLVLFPVHLATNYPRDGAALQKLVKQKCNASQGLKDMGINRASALVLTGQKGLARSMADPSGGDEDVVTEFGFDPGDSIVRRTRQRGRLMKNGVAKAGETAVAVLGPGYQSAEWMSAALGQTLMGLPPGNNVGFGVGGQDEGNAGGGGAPQTGWRQCDKLQGAAFDRLQDRFKYMKDLEKYLGFPKQGAKLYDLTKDRPLFGDGRSTPQQGQAKQQQTSGGAGGAGSSPTVSGPAPGANANASTVSAPTPISPSPMGPRGSSSGDYAPPTDATSPPDEELGPVTSGHEPSSTANRASDVRIGNRNRSSPGFGLSGTGESGGRSGLGAAKPGAVPGVPGGAGSPTNFKGGTAVDDTASQTPANKRPPSSLDADFLRGGSDSENTPEPEWPRRSKGSGRTQGIYGEGE